MHSNERYFRPIQLLNMYVKVNTLKQLFETFSTNQIFIFHTNSLYYHTKWKHWLRLPRKIPHLSLFCLGFHLITPKIRNGGPKPSRILALEVSSRRLAGTRQSSVGIARESESVGRRITWNCHVILYRAVSGTAIATFQYWAVYATLNWQRVLDVTDLIY